jgi:hypothetical protein
MRSSCICDVFTAFQPFKQSQVSSFFPFAHTCSLLHASNSAFSNLNLPSAHHIVPRDNHIIRAIMPINQGLLKRNPSLSPKEFSDSWYGRHAQLVVPFFLHSGVTYYAQIHAPLSTTLPGLDLTPFSGAAEMPSEDVLKIFAPDPPMPQWVKEYYEEVILEDEKRLLESLAAEHIVQVEEGTVSGEKRVIIQGGKSVVQVEGGGGWETWRRYEERGKEAAK